MSARRKRLYIVLFAFAALYLIVHYLIFDREFTFTTFPAFIAEGREHVWHVAPLILIFLIFFGKEAYDRIKKRTPSQEAGS